MNIPKNQKIRFAIIAGLLILVVAGLWVWRFKFKSSADTEAQPVFFDYQIKSGSSNFKLSPSIEITDKNLVTLKKIPFEEMKFKPVVSEIENFTALSKWLANIGGKTAQEFLVLKDSKNSIINLVVNSRKSIDSGNMISTTTPFDANKPIIFSTDVFNSLAANTAIQGLQVNVVQKVLNDTVNVAISSDLNLMLVDLKAKNEATKANPSVKTYTKLNGSLFEYLFDKNVVLVKKNAADKGTVVRRPWQPADLKKLYIGILPYAKDGDNTTYQLGSVRLSGKIGLINANENIGMVTPTEQTIVSNSSKNDLTAWQYLLLDKVTLGPNSAAKIQWFAGSKEQVLADINRANSNKEFVASCKSDCSFIMPLENIKKNYNLKSLKNQKYNKSPVGRYGGFVLKYWIQDASVKAPEINSLITVQTTVPRIYSPVIYKASTNVLAGRIMTIDGKYLETDVFAEIVSIDPRKTKRYKLENLEFDDDNFRQITATVPLNVPNGSYNLILTDPDSNSVTFEDIDLITKKPKPASIFVVGEKEISCPENITLSTYWKAPDISAKIKVMGKKLKPSNIFTLKDINNSRISYPLTYVSTDQKDGSITLSIDGTVKDNSYYFTALDDDTTCKIPVRADKIFTVSKVKPDNTDCPKETDMAISKDPNAEMKIVTNAKIVDRSFNDFGTLVTITGNDFGKTIGKLNLVDQSNPTKKIKIKNEVMPGGVSRIVKWDTSIIKFYMPKIDADWDKKEFDIPFTEDVFKKIKPNNKNFPQTLLELKAIAKKERDDTIFKYTQIVWYKPKIFLGVKKYDLEVTANLNGYDCKPISKEIRYGMFQAQYKYVKKNSIQAAIDTALVEAKSLVPDVKADGIDVLDALEQGLVAQNPRYVPLPQNQLFDKYSLEAYKQNVIITFSKNVLSIVWNMLMDGLGNLDNPAVIDIPYQIQ